MADLSHDVNEIYTLRKNLQRGKTQSYSELNNMSQCSCIDSTKQSQISRLRKINDYLISSQTVSVSSQSNTNNESDSNVNRKIFKSAIKEFNYAFLQYQAEISRLDSEIKYYQFKFENIIANSDNTVIKDNIEVMRDKIKQKKKENEEIRKKNSEITNENKEISNNIKLLIRNNKIKEKSINIKTQINEIITPIPMSTPIQTSTHNTNITPLFPFCQVNTLFD